MRRISLPAFVHEVVDDPRQRGILIAGSLALFAVGLVPRVLSPGLPNAQELIKAQPTIENVFLVLSFLSTATIILGGLVSDVYRRRSLLVAALVVMVVAEGVNIVVRADVVFYGANMAAVAASGVVLAYGIGSVAIAYEGVPRATALGVVYAAYGAGTATAPAVLTLFPRILDGVPVRFTFDTSLAYLLAATASALALGAALRWMPAIPGAIPASRPLIIAVALWSISILAIVSGLLALGGETSAAVPIVLIIGGVIGLSTLTYRLDRTARTVEQLRLDKRALAAALVVGMAIGFAQAIPLMVLPVLFQYPLGYGPFFSMLAIAPFAIALFVAGPVSGILLQRFGPRGMMAVGTGMLGLANLVLAGTLDAIGRQAHYIAFILPLAFIGAGFVLSTTVRTAIVFASTPRGLPSMAAAINEASVGLGSRIGIVGGTTALVLAALDSARAMVVDRADGSGLVEEFREVLVALGTPLFKDLLSSALESADELKAQAYVVAYIDGVEVVLVISGVVGIAGALAAWFLTGRRDPLRTVFDMQDEREAAPPEATETALSQPS